MSTESHKFNTIFQSDGLEPDDRQNGAISDEQSQSKAKTDIGPHPFLSNSEPNQAETRSDLVIDPSLAAHEPSQPQPISFPFPMPVAPTNFPFFPVPPFYFHYPYPPPPFQYQQPPCPHPQPPDVVDNNSEPEQQNSFSDDNDNNFHQHCPEDQHEDHYLNQTQHDDLTFDDCDRSEYQQSDYGEYDGSGDGYEYDENGYYEDYN